ncbi:MAG: BamA/TamA family outer membrane protein [Deltaproteobacteria bacterium]|nr:BamA/TamA family outer membrane protein [Deltaproteobacteria bacterium]
MSARAVGASRAWRAACVLLPVAFAIACAAPQKPANGQPELKAIDFAGNASIPTTELRGKIASEPSGGLLKPQLRTYDEDLFNVDLERVLRWYRQKGFYKIKITNVEETRDLKGAVTLTVHLEEGPHAKVDKLTIDGIEALEGKARDRLYRKLPLHTGDPFDEDLFEATKLSLEALLKEGGYAAADGTGEVLISEDGARATVSLHSKAGKRFKIGRINVEGNRGVSAELIKKATGLEKDEWFATSKLELAQQRVYNLGPFSGVRVSLEPLGDSDIAGVRISVREAPFQTLRYGLGLQIENARWEVPRLRAEYTHRNLFGGARRLELASTAGYAFTPGPIDPLKTGIVTLSSAQLTFPALLPSLDLVTRGEFSRELQSGFDYNQIAGRLGLSWRWGRLSVAPSMNYVRTFNATLDLDLGTLISSNPNPAVGLLDNCVPACSLIYPELRVGWDGRNNVLAPTRGLYVAAGLQRTFFGSFRYWKFEPEVRFYYTTSPITWAVRGYWGALYVLKGGSPSSPFTQRFFGGGQGWQRGYGAGRQGPKVGAQLDANGYATATVPIGGNGAFLLSGEARISTDVVLKNSGVVLFLDASSVTAEAELPFKSALEYAPGLGLRYKTPFGPVRLDIAYLLNPIDVLASSPSPNTPATPAGAGCDPAAGPCVHEPRINWHLTLGEAF